MSSFSGVPLVEHLTTDHEAEGSNPAWQQQKMVEKRCIKYFIPLDIYW